MCTIISNIEYSSSTNKKGVILTTRYYNLVTEDHLTSSKVSRTSSPDST